MIQKNTSKQRCMPTTKNKKPGNKRSFNRRMDQLLHIIHGGCPWERGFCTLSYTYQKYLNVQKNIVLLLGIYPKEIIKNAWNNSTSMIFRSELL